MKSHRSKLALAMASAALVTLAGCGGGDGSSTAPPQTTTAPAAKTVMSGTAATGAALANANVTITNSSGNSPCEEASITTTALGTYTCTLKSAETAPFFVVVTDPTGNSAPLVSIATTTPAAGAALTVNATPLTTAIVAQLASDGNALSVVNSKTVDTAALKKVTTNVLAQLANVLKSISAPADYDPFSTAIAAATPSSAGNTADQLLDIVKVTTDPTTGKPAIATVDNPTPILLAGADNSGTALPAPDAGLSDLPKAAQLVAKSLTACFALPTSQRVLATDTSVPAAQGGPTVTSAAPACQNIAAASNNAAGVEFLHNGFEAGQYLYNTLTSDTMTGAQFSVPEVMAFYGASSTTSGKDEAVLNIKYLDAAGNPGNLITVARNIASGSTQAHPSTWWLVGNQQPVDVTVRPLVRRVEQINPANTQVFSRFQTGIQFQVNAKGPGSVTADGTLTYARVTGPMLPKAGLVYIAPVNAEVGQNYMDVSNKVGSVTNTTRCGGSNGGAQSYNCPNFWIGRTAGLTGTAATTFANNAGGPSWAQTSDNLDTTFPAKGQRYQIELFYGSKTTPTYTYHKTLLSDMIVATQAVNLPWNTPGSATLAFLDPNGSLAGAQTSTKTDWIQNIAAEQIGSVAVTVDAIGSYSTSKQAPKGVTSLVVEAPVPAMTSSSVRAVLFGYRMLNNSNKTAVYTYN
ncbi:hypothetical protein [Cupriavidus sp. TMH.W2]|uniref:hypothetical protein n=1 Tax=Cupriavidus sp. TMH.W2 TaxID=3434465 RepID=UPI003D76B9E1